MLRGRIFPIVTALLAVLVLGIVAPVLESTPISSPYEVPTSTDQSGSGSLMSLTSLSFELMDSSPLTDFLGLVISHSTSLVVLLMAGFVLGTLVLARQWLSLSLSKQILRPFRKSNRTDDIPAQPEDDSWPPANPGSGVTEAWFDMTASVDVDRPASRTPTEWADAAVNDGLNPDAVLTLTALFEEIQYGGATETPEHRRQANRELDRLEDGSE